MLSSTNVFEHQILYEFTNRKNISELIFLFLHFSLRQLPGLLSHRGVSFNPGRGGEDHPNHRELWEMGGSPSTSEG